MPTTSAQKPLILELIKISGIWFLSDIGFFVIRSFIGVESSYSNNPFVLALYYALWVCVTLVLFWGSYKKWNMVTVNSSMLTIVALSAALVASYILFIFPNFPPIQWLPYTQPPPELFSASPWYFLPKSIEIVLQQLLVTAMVLALQARNYSMREIANRSAILFGGVHVALVFNQSFAYVMFFMVCATAAGFIFAHLLLRVRNGFLYSFMLHWSFYAVIIVLIRILYVH